MHRIKRCVVGALIGVVATWGAFFAMPVQAQDATAYAPMDMDALEQLVSPVALYPDAMLAQVFVACTYPDDVIAASQWLAAGNDPSGIANQPWDLSVQGVAQYPDVLNYLASNPDYMNDLGAAFANQQADVMTAVQNLRAQAVAAGNLVSNDQIQVVNDNGTIEIIPTDPATMYVPTYDPSLVYQPIVLDPGQVYTPCIVWGDRCPVGFWLHHDIDWHDHSIYVGNWGADRPWWHHDFGGHDYAHARPGLIAGGRIDLGHGHVYNGGQWTRDAHKPMPRPTGHFTSAGLNRGYPTPNRDNRTPVHSVPVRGTPPRPTDVHGTSTRTPTPTRGTAPNDYNKGARVTESSTRGQNSMNTTPKSTPTREPINSPKPLPSPTPTREPTTPTRTHEPTTPTARPSTPSRGGASGGYQPAASVARSTNRGEASTNSHPAPAAPARSPEPARSNPTPSNPNNPNTPGSRH